jgi:hypothetical protein
MRSALLTVEGAAVTNPLRIIYALVYCVDWSAVLVPLLVVQWQRPAESNFDLAVAVMLVALCHAQ